MFFFEAIVRNEFFIQFINASWSLQLGDIFSLFCINWRTLILYLNMTLTLFSRSKRKHRIITTPNTKKNALGLWLWDYGASDQNKRELWCIKRLECRKSDAEYRGEWLVQFCIQKYLKYSRELARFFVRLYIFRQRWKLKISETFPERTFRTTTMRIGSSLHRLKIYFRKIMHHCAKIYCIILQGAFLMQWEMSWIHKKTIL